MSVKTFSWTPLTLLSIFALTACAPSQAPTFTTESSKSSSSATPEASKSSATPSASPASSSARASSSQASVSPSPARSSSTTSMTTSASATPQDSGSSSAIAAELVPINDFMNAIYAEGAQAKVNHDLFVQQIVQVLPANATDSATNDSQLISKLSEADAQKILETMKATLPYSSTVSFENMSVQDQVSALLAMSGLSVKLNQSTYVYKNFHEAKGFTIINMEGTDKITFHALTSDSYVDGKNVGLSNPTENYDFAVVKTATGWKLDGPKMLAIIESHQSK